MRTMTSVLVAWPLLARRRFYARLLPGSGLCRHREWYRLGAYPEHVACRMLDDLC